MTPILTEADRRLLGNLSEPRSVPTLTRILRADANAPFDDTASFDEVRDQVANALDGLLHRRYVVELGSHSTAKSMLRAVDADEDAIAIPKVKAEALASRLESGRDGRLDTGPLVILSKRGLAALEA
jgi:hypothetical protein